MHWEKNCVKTRYLPGLYPFAIVIVICVAKLYKTMTINDVNVSISNENVSKLWLILMQLFPFMNRRFYWFVMEKLQDFIDNSSKICMPKRLKILFDRSLDLFTHRSTIRAQTLTLLPRIFTHSLFIRLSLICMNEWLE